jgi:hypothetical protein
VTPTLHVWRIEDPGGHRITGEVHRERPRRTDNLTIADYVTEAKVQIKKAGVIPGPLLNPAP